MSQKSFLMFWYFHLYMAGFESCVFYFILVRHALSEGWGCCSGKRIRASFGTRRNEHALPSAAGALPSHSPWHGQKFCCLGLRTDGAICQLELFGTLFCKYDQLGATSSLRLPLWLDLDLQCQTEGNPYISSFLDGKQSENQSKSQVPRSHFICACPKDLRQSLEFYGTRLLATFVAKVLWNKTRIGGCKSCLSAVKSKTDSVISWLIFPYISLVLKYSKWAFLQQLTNNSATSFIFLGSLWGTFIQSSRIV